MKKVVVILIICFLNINILSGCFMNGAGSKEKIGRNSKIPDLSKVELDLLTSFHPSWPFNKDWWIWKEIEEETGIRLNIVAIHNNEYSDKVNLVITSGNLPDIFTVGPASARRLGADGAFLELSPFIDQMPNFKKFIEFSPETYEAALDADGNLYCFPYYGMGETNRRGWMYREDIFKKHNLQLPKDYNELYKVLVKLKETYPDSYPLGFRSGIKQFEMISPQWNTNDDCYYDFDKKEWRYGPIEDSFKELVIFFSKLFKEGLMPPDWLTITTKQWQDLMSTNHCFVTIDYIGRIDFFNLPMRSDNPDYKLSYMPPPAGKNGKQVFAYSHFAEGGAEIASTSKKVNSIIDLYDFLYSEEGKELTSWGKEGETYTVVNGVRKFINVNEMADIRKNYGITTNGAGVYFDYSSHLSTFSDELNTAIIESKKFDGKRQPIAVLKQNELNESAVADTAIKKHRDENIAKFIMGERDISEWSNYVAETKKLGVDKILDIYSAAYNRIKNIK